MGISYPFFHCVFLKAHMTEQVLCRGTSQGRASMVCPSDRNVSHGCFFGFLIPGTLKNLGWKNICRTVETRIPENISRCWEIFSGVQDMPLIGAMFQRENFNQLKTATFLLWVQKKRILPSVSR